MIESLRAAIPSITSVNLLPDDGSRVEIRASTPHGDAIISLRRRAFSPSNPHQLLVLMLFSGFVMTLIAYLFLKNQLRPIIRLAQASKAFGQGRHVDLDVSGATEVREASRAFLGMRESIETHMEQRTQMLSNIGHDLRTPLTRLRIGLETLTESSQTKMLISDVRNMTFMVNELLDFTKDASTEEFRAVSVVELAESVAKSARVAGQDISFVKLGNLNQDVLLNARPLAITRALENLVANAGSYAEANVDLRWRRRAQASWLIVEDDGPGIPADQTHRGYAAIHPVGSCTQFGQGKRRRTRAFNCSGRGRRARRVTRTVLERNPWRPQGGLDVCLLAMRARRGGRTAVLERPTNGRPGGTRTPNLSVMSAQRLTIELRALNSAYCRARPWSSGDAKCE